MGNTGIKALLAITLTALASSTPAMAQGARIVVTASLDASSPQQGLRTRLISDLRTMGQVTPDPELFISGATADVLAAKFGMFSFVPTSGAISPEDYRINIQLEGAPNGWPASDLALKVSLDAKGQPTYTRAGGGSVILKRCGPDTPDSLTKAPTWLVNGIQGAIDDERLIDLLRRVPISTTATVFGNKKFIRTELSYGAARLEPRKPALFELHDSDDNNLAQDVFFLSCGMGRDINGPVVEPKPSRCAALATAILPRRVAWSEIFFVRFWSDR